MEHSDRAAAERLEALRRELAPVRRSLDRIAGADPSGAAAPPPRREAVEPLGSAEIAARAAADARREDSSSPVGFPVGGTALPGSLPGSLVEALAQVRAREVSPEELGADALARAESSGLGAFLETGDGPPRVRVADEGDGAVADLPLGGLPLTLKDIFDAAGWTTTSGSRFPVRAEADSWAWARLAAAGAALLGKTNLNEWAFGVDGGNPHFGPTRNPRDPERIVGGSSSGSAASLAAGIGYGSLGSDTGGSIRIPAALTGIFGLKPTWGRLSRAGVTPLSWSLDHIGPMARSAADLGLLWSVLSGESASGGAPAAGAVPDSAPLAGLTAGVPENFFFDDLTPEARAAAERVVRALEGIGVRAAPVRIPEIELAGVCRTVIAFAEAAAFHRRRLLERPADFGGAVRMLLTAGAGLSADEVLTALRGRRLVTDAVSRAFEAVDFLITPTTPAGAPRLGEAALDTGEDLRGGLMRLVGPFDLTGHPALQIPAGRDRNAMPLGAQLVGPHGGEGILIRAARELEAAGAGSREGAGAPPPGCYIPPDAARR